MPVTTTRLFYVYDPMCSWCWGFRPVWDALCLRLPPELSVTYVLGGLAPESHAPMAEAMQLSLQATWRRVGEVCGAQFNFDFWGNNTPLRSTYPACKAVLVARDYGLEVEMYHRIQAYYYLEAGNPSVYAHLYDLAAGLGIDRATFIERIHAEATEQGLLEEVQFAEQLGAQGFPSLLLQVDGATHFIHHSYTSVAANMKMIEALLPGKPV